MDTIEPHTRIGYLGPPGTYTEHALLSQADLAAAIGQPYLSIPDVLTALAEGSIDTGFVPIENAIEGSVNVTQDTLAFDLNLLIQREVVLDVRLDLLALPDTKLDEIHTVASFPVALAQCRTFLHENLPDVQIQAATSTAEAARQLSEERPARQLSEERPAEGGRAVIASQRAAQVYGLATLNTAIEDHPGNQTRFLLLAAEGTPPPTGHDKTSIVVFQARNVPGSLLQILQEFAARGLDLTRLESRPTRQRLGDYCFVLDFNGHIADEVVADCLRHLKMKQHDVKFLGSYPVSVSSDAGGASSKTAAQAHQAATDDRSQADDWVSRLRHGIRN